MIWVRIDTEAMKIVFSCADAPLINFHIPLNGLLGSAGSWRDVDPADIYFLPHTKDEGRPLDLAGRLVSVAMAIRGQWVATLFPASPAAMKAVLDGNCFKWPVEETDYVPVHMRRVKQRFQRKAKSQPEEGTVEVSLEHYVGNLRHDAIGFLRFWEKAYQKVPDAHPMMLTEAQWDSEFQAFLHSRKEA